MNQIATTYPAMPKNQNGLRLCHLLSTLALALLPAWAAAQTAPLNDTGQMQCVNNAGTWAAACDAGSTGNAATHPGQDGRFGRDAAQAAGALPPKTGGGAAGFDFTALDAGGNDTATGSHACVKDNVTGLTWEVKQAGANTDLRYTGHAYAWYDSSHPSNPGSQGANTCNGTLPGSLCNTQAYAAAVNAAGLCGQTTGWRLPTRRELLSIVHNGAYSPAIDQTYFPGTASSWYWSSDTYAPDPAVAWGVFFYDGFAGADGKAGTNSTRLVRSGQ